MHLLDLPLELFLDVWDILDDEEEYETMNALVQTCHYFHQNFNSRLYEAVTESHDGTHEALTWAIRNGPTGTMEKFLDAGIDMMEYEFIFNMAAKHNRSDSIKLWIEHGFDPNKGNYMNQTALHNAAMHDHVEVAQLLLDSGADIHAPDSDSYTALSYAVAKGGVNVLKMLLERGASTDVTMEYPGIPLALAAKKARFGHDAIVRRLLDAGADINVVTDYDKDCLHLAAAGGHPKVVRTLLERGMDPNAEDERGYSPLSWACYSRSPNEEVIKVLLEYNADTEIKNDSELTALGIAARMGRAGAVQPLLAKGADPTTTEEFGCTPLILATRFGHADVALTILDDGTPPDTWNRKDFTPEEKGQDTYRRSIDMPDSRGRTPLFLATLYGFHDLVKLLLCRGSAAMQIPTCAGRTPVSIVEAQRQMEFTAGTEDLQRTWQAIENPLDATVDLAELYKFAERSEDDSVVEAWCDSCDVPLSVWDTHFHCDYCDNGDFDICAECFALGDTCYDATHTLYRTRRVNNSWHYDYDDPVEQVDAAVMTGEFFKLAITA
ncbi:hypothetical protein N7492_004759 [Penicillium capsulatum]|uniref:Uncharacterized protein n=1 Tax=Penicillium capsulatum TaxID=69766 RepID=A0A9W9LR15_9EURO|nr:hypothetical protein N7492_004759 [Penicillium capsulatum]